MQNNGDSAVRVTGVRTNIADELLMTTAINVPLKRFEHQTYLLGNDLTPDGSYGVLSEGQYLEIQPGETSELKCALQWQLPGESPPIVAVLRDTFSEYGEGDEQLAQCEPTVFIVQSQTGALDAVLGGPEATLRSAAIPLEMISWGEGKKSKGVLELMRQFKQRGLIGR